MAGRIRAQDVAAVRDRSPIADIVGQYVQLKPAGGGSLKGLCPFHDERSPSFHLTPARGVYYCFGCGEGGDVLTFLEKVEHLSFAEAVEKLALRAGVELHYEQAGPAARTGSQRTRFLEAHAAAAEFYAEQLVGPDAATAREFLSSRGFDRGAAEQFGCGFSPASWDTLTSHLRGRGFTPQELITGGLSREGRSGGLIDRFRARLMWPIRDLSGDVVGFGARRLRDDDGPKYLNTPETPIYHKSHVLYGVDLAKKEIARRRQAVVVEGYTDVMACHLSGVPTAVATCGTAFGSDHVGILRRLLMDQDEFRGEVIFTFDGDEAGRKAAMRAFADDQRFVMQTFVAVEKHGLDPCDVRLEHGEAAVRDLVASRRPLVQFVIDTTISKYDLDTAEGRVQALESAAPLVAGIKDRALRPEYARLLAGQLGMDVAVVNDAVGRAGSQRGQTRDRVQDRGHDQGRGQHRGQDRGRHQDGGGRDDVPSPRERQQDGGQPQVSDIVLAVEREALKVAVQQPVLAGPLFDSVGSEAWVDPRYRAVREAIAAAGGAASGVPGPDWVERVRQPCPDDSVRSLVYALATEPIRAAGEVDARYAHAVLARLQEVAVTRKIAALKSRLQRVNPVESAEEHTRLFGELIALEQYKRGLREQAIGAL